MATESSVEGGEEEMKVMGGNRELVVDNADLREMATKIADWSVSSCKPGNGVSFLRDDNYETYWQCRSDGAQPHLVNIQFQKKVKLQVDKLCERCHYKRNMHCKKIYDIADDFDKVHDKLEVRKLILQGIRCRIDESDVEN